MTSNFPMANLGTGDIGFARGQGAVQNKAAALQSAARGKDADALRETAVEFEAQFLSQMMGHMFQGIGSGNVFGGGHAEEIWRDFYVDEVTKSFTNRGGIGLADTIEKQLLKLQEAG
jgi:peptidoglycan hydrolase FlgJ